MALFRLPTSGSPALAPRGNGLVLRAPQMSDFLQWTHLRETSRNYLTPWEPIWPSDDLTRSGFRRRLRRYAEDIAADRSYPFLVFRESDGAMIGGVTLANVRRGIVQDGTIGYWVGQPHAHRGHMTAALRVLPIEAASAGTRASDKVQMTALSAGSRARVMPWATIWESQRIGAPARSAALAAMLNPGVNTMSSATSTMPLAWMIRTAIFSSWASNRSSLASERMIENER